MTEVRPFGLCMGVALLATLGCAASSTSSTTHPADAPMGSTARAEPTAQLLALREHIARAHSDGGLTSGRCTTWAEELVALHVDHGEPYVGARLEAATLLHVCGRPDQARDRLLEALDAMPRWARAEALNTLGVLAHERGDDGGAIVYLQGALHADPALHEARSNLVRLLLRIYDGGGSELARDDAQHNLDAWLELEPADAVARLQHVRLLMIRARREPAGAEVARREATLLLGGLQRLDLSPAIAAEASILAGQLRLAAGDEVAALRMFKRALELDPSRGSAALLVATIALRMRDYETARRVLAAAVITVDPVEEPARLRLLAVALRGLRYYDDAAATYERLLSVEQPEPIDLYNRAQLELYRLELDDQPAMERLDRARGWFGEVIAATQGKPAHAELWRLAKAEHERLEALELESQPDEGHLRMDPDAVELEKRERKLMKGERKRLLELEAKAKAAAKGQ